METTKFAISIQYITVAYVGLNPEQFKLVYDNLNGSWVGEYHSDIRVDVDDYRALYKDEIEDPKARELLKDVLAQLDERYDVGEICFYEE